MAGLPDARPARPRRPDDDAELRRAWHAWAGASPSKNQIEAVKTLDFYLNRVNGADPRTLAENRIEAAKMSVFYLDEVKAEDPRTYTLCLNTLGLPDMPPGMDRLPVHRMVLAGNRLTHLQLDAGSESYPGLYDLSLADNPLQDISGLRQLPSLRELDLSRTGARWQQDDLGALAQLTALQLDGWPSTTPPLLDKLTNLTWLCMEDGEFTTAPIVRKCIRLEVLRVADGLIHTAPDVSTLGEQRARQEEALQQARRQANERATQEERDSEFSELNLGHDSRYGEIHRQHEEGLRGIHRQFTRIAMDRVAVGQPAFDTLPTPAHVIAAAKVADIATRLRALRRQDQTAEARTLARQLLQPALVAALHHAPPSTMSTREAKAMDIANVQYMDLLRTLAADDLLDAREAFDLLLGIDPPPGHEETPYLLHIASRAGAVQRDTPDTAPQLAHAVTQLLHTLAETRKLGRAQTRQDVRADMRRALLTQDHPRQTTELGRQKYEKYIDFYARLLLSASPSEPGKTAKRAARALASSRLLPTREEIRAVGLSEIRAGKFKPFFEKAAGPGRTAPSREADEEPTDNLDKVVQALGQLNIAGAHAMRLQQLAIETALQHTAEARANLHSAVRGAVDAQWEAGTRHTRRALAPHGLSGLLDPVGAAAYASAARSVRTAAPGNIADKVCDALLATPEGQAVLHDLVAMRRPYSAEGHPEFDDMLRHMAGREVRLELAHAESRLRGRARATIATARAREADAQTARQNTEEAEADAQTRQVQARASQPATSTGGLPPASSEGPSAKRMRTEVPPAAAHDATSRTPHAQRGSWPRCTTCRLRKWARAKPRPWTSSTCSTWICFEHSPPRVCSMPRRPSAACSVPMRHLQGTRRPISCTSPRAPAPGRGTCPTRPPLSRMRSSS